MHCEVTGHAMYNGVVGRFVISRRERAGPIVVMMRGSRWPWPSSRGDAVKYMLLIGGAEDGWDHLNEAEQRELYGEITTWWDERIAAGDLLEGAQLQPVTTATTVRRSISGDISVTDGPFVEGKEMIGGYGVIDVPDLDAAIRLASSWPAPDTIEIRPLVTGEMG